MNVPKYYNAKREKRLKTLSARTEHFYTVIENSTDGISELIRISTRKGASEIKNAKAIEKGKIK